MIDLFEQEISVKMALRAQVKESEIQGVIKYCRKLGYDDEKTIHEIMENFHFGKRRKISFWQNQ